MSLISPLMALGLNSIITREILTRPKQKHRIVGTAIALRGLAAFCLLPIAVWLAFLYMAHSQAILFAVLIFSSSFNAANVVDFWLQAHSANRFAAIIRLISLSIFSIARLLAITLDAELHIFVYLAALEMILLSLLYLLAYQRLSAGVRRLRVSMIESKRLLKDSRWLIVSGLAAIIYLKIDQVMLGMMLDDESIGIYAAATRVSEVWYFIPAAIAVSFFPRLIKQKAVTKEGYKNELQKINDALFCIGLAIAIVVSTFSDILLFLFGEAYTDSVPVLVAHIWAGIFVFMRALLSKWLITENLLKLSMFSQVLGAVVNVTLNIQFIPIYGPLGAAYATVISHAVAGYVVLFCHRDLWPMAMVVTRSFILPIRLARKGVGLYKN